MDRRELMASGGAWAASMIGGVAPTAAHAAPDTSFDKLRRGIRGKVVTPSDDGYGIARRGYGTTPVKGRTPAAVIQPEGPDDIVRALDFARSRSLDISVRSGGHDLLGASTSTKGVLIDLARMNAIRIDPAAGIAQVGGGARAGELTSAGAPHGLVPTLGMNPNVGVGGLTLGGGIGWLSGRFGATVDNLLAVQLVTADGRTIVADRERNADLFWGLRGGGGNFGVATAFTYKMHPVSQVLAGDIGFKASPAKLLRFLRGFLAESPDELDIGVLFTLGADPTAIVRLCWSGLPDEGEKALRPLRGIAPTLIDTVKLQSYASLANGAPRFDNMFLRGGEFSCPSSEHSAQVAA